MTSRGYLAATRERNICSLNTGIKASGSYSTYVVFGTNSGSSISVGFLPWLFADQATITITAVTINGNTSYNRRTDHGLSVFSKIRSGFSIQSDAAHASAYKGNFALLYFTISF